MDILKRILHDYNERRASEAAKPLPTPSCVREASATERNRVYTPPNTGLLFCCHGKSYFDVCSACRRDRKRARMEYDAFLKRHGLSV